MVKYNLQLETKTGLCKGISFVYNKRQNLQDL